MDAPVQAPVVTKFHKDVAVVGETLDNYTKRVPSEDGTYVRVTRHTEWLEEIEQPPTPEEIAAAREQKRQEDRLAARILVGIGVGFFGLVGFMMWSDSKRLKVEPPVVEA